MRSRNVTSRDLSRIPRIAPTPRPERSKFEKLTSMADDLVRMSERDLEDFKKKLGEEPAYAFEWSSNAFQAAADLKVGRMIQANLASDVNHAGREVTEEERAQFILREALRIAMNEARNPSHSTSVQSNEMERCIASAWAKVYQRVEQGVF